MKSFLLKVKEKWIDIEISIIDWILLQLFKVSSSTRKHEIINTHVKEFFTYNDIAKRINDDGDFVGSLYFSGVSLDHLGKIVVYSNILSIDVKKLLNEYKDENNKTLT